MQEVAGETNVTGVSSRPQSRTGGAGRITASRGQTIHPGRDEPLIRTSQDDSTPRSNVTIVRAGTPGSEPGQLPQLPPLEHVPTSKLLGLSEVGRVDRMLASHRAIGTLKSIASTSGAGALGAFYWGRPVPAAVLGVVNISSKALFDRSNEVMNQLKLDESPVAWKISIVLTNLLLHAGEDKEAAVKSVVKRSLGSLAPHLEQLCGSDGDRARNAALALANHRGLNIALGFVDPVVERSAPIDESRLAPSTTLEESLAGRFWDGQLQIITSVSVQPEPLQQEMPEVARLSVPEAHSFMAPRTSAETAASVTEAGVEHLDESEPLLSARHRDRTFPPLPEHTSNRPAAQTAGQSESPMRPVDLLTSHASVEFPEISHLPDPVARGDNSEARVAMHN